MAQSPITRSNTFSRLISTGGSTPSNEKLSSRLIPCTSTENQPKRVAYLETNFQPSTIATPDSLVDFSFVRPNSQPSRLSQDSTGASISSVTTAVSSIDYRRDSIALAENSLSNSPNSKIGVYLHQVRNGLPSPSPSPRELPMSKSEVLHVKKLVDDYISRDPQAQKLRTQVTRLVNHALALDEARHAGLLSSKRKIDTLNDYIYSLTLTKQSSTSRLELQSTEIDLLKRQAMALSNKMSSSPVVNRWLASPSPRGNSKRKLDENKGETIYSGINPFKGTIESQTRLLVQENRTLENKLEQSEAQVQRLSKEFQKLRSLVTGGSDLIPLAANQDVDARQAIKSKLNRDDDFLMNLSAARSIGSPTAKQLTRSLTKSVPHKRRRTMGDAEAEHLLLASERLTSISRSRNSASSLAGSYLNSPSIKLASQRLKQSPKAKRVISDSILYEGLADPSSNQGSEERRIISGQQVVEPIRKAKRPTGDIIQIEDDEEEKVLEKMIVPNRLTFVPQAQQQQKDSRTPCCSVEKRAGLMDDLLAAAETVLTRVSSPAAEPSSGKTIDDETPYHKKTKSHHTSGEPSPEVSSMVVIHQQAEQTARNLVTGLQKYPSGLDVLADQAFASSSQNRDETISNGLSSSLSSSPCSKNQTATPPQAPILYSSELSEVEPEGQQQKKPKAVTELHEDIDPSLSKLDRTTDKSQAGPEKSSEARKKIRSPYLKWNSSEDEMLVKAVSKYGLRWESVSRCVPSRSYHQCRQRWLRGLKGGENLPDDLQSYYPAIQVALKLFNVSRKKSIAENEPGVELEEEYEEEEGEEEGETADTVQSKLEIEKDKTSYDEPKNRVNLNEKLDEPAKE